MTETTATCPDCKAAMRELPGLCVFSCLGCGRKITCRQIHADGLVLKPDPSHAVPLAELYLFVPDREGDHLTSMLPLDQPMAPPEDAREAVPGEAAEAESAMAPQATNDPTAVNPAQPSGPSTDGPPEPKLPPGQCQNCGTLVFRAEIERHEGRPPCHRARKSRHDLVGELCGPVTTVWVYHVAFRGLDDKLHAGQVPLAMPMERGNSMQIASRMLSGLMPGDETSPLVEILWWTALGMA